MGVEKTTSTKKRARALRIRKSKRFERVKDYDQLRVATKGTQARYVEDKDGNKRRVNRWSAVTLAKRRGQYYRKHPENIVNRGRFGAFVRDSVRDLLQVEEGKKSGVTQSFINVCWSEANAWLGKRIDVAKIFARARDHQKEKGDAAKKEFKGLTLMGRDFEPSRGLIALSKN